MVHLNPKIQMQVMETISDDGGSGKKHNEMGVNKEGMDGRRKRE